MPRPAKPPKRLKRTSTCWISLWRGTLIHKMISATRLVFPVPGRRLPTFSAESDEPKKPGGLKHREPNSGTTGTVSFQMLNFYFANP